MKITKLTLSNYRGATSLPLEFHHRLNVFVGLNGSGKSSILDATAILLSWLVNRIKHAGVSGRPITESDIQNGKSAATLNMACEHETRKVEWRLAKSRRGHGAQDERSALQELNDLARQWRGTIAETNEEMSLPLLAYFPVNRAVLDIPLRIREKHRVDLMSAYDGSLTSGANFRTFFEWFREREDLENENRKYVDDLIKPDGYEFPDSQLEAVRGALYQFLPEFTHLSVRRNPLRMEVQKNGKHLTVNQLSDGEKCLMAMVGDLARRMAIANPAGDNPLEGAGIVLIDEIDLHLHPKWQRMIVSKLLDVFPNCQFIISTHSPHVITHVQSESLYMLTQTESGMVAEQPGESYGKNVDRILEDLMGLETTRPDQVSDSLHHLYVEINGGRFAEARQMIEQMKAEIGADPALVKAEVLIKRREILGK